jgi:pimeloyl-ACP methyl ester carboxylesterase
MTQGLAFEPMQAEAGEPIREYDVRGGGGITLRAREWGNPNGRPILFVHGWSQCDLCWTAQTSGPLAARFRMITFDNRGHGTSEKPLDASCYADERLWADDLAAVIEQTRLERPVVVAWSYGGFIVADYVRAHGDGGIAGIGLVGASVLLRPPSFDHLGPGLLDNAQDACAPDLRTSIPAIQRFLRSCTARALDERLWSTALCWNMAVPAEVRGALIAREIDEEDVLARLSVPVLVTHGTEDAIVLPSMAEHTLEHCNTAIASWYEGIGHMPFIENAERFNRELAAFAEQA